MSYYISKDPDYELVFEDALFYPFGLRMPMPKLIFTHYASLITHHASPITDHALRIIQVWEDRSNRNEQIIDLLHSYPNPWKNELEYFDMNAMPRIIPMCPNMNMV